MAIKINLKASCIRQVYILVALLTCVIYGYLGYFSVRSEFVVLISLCGITFLSTYLFVEKSDFNFKQLLYLSIIYKLVFIMAIPNLSQDFYRFFWDGQLVLQGINPYLENVNDYFIKDSYFKVHQAEILRDGMGSLNASNYSNYPPFSQLLYAISAWIAQDSIHVFIISLRVLLIGFDLIFICFAKKILSRFNKNPKALFWYALNPLCIIEITGNLHLEGVMIALFISGIYLLIKYKYVLSGALLSLSVGTKLLSLIAIPLIIVFIWRRGEANEKFKKSVVFIITFAIVLGFQFLPFIDSVFLENYAQTIGLWFGKFEFNASIYYVVRWIGFQIYGYNIIQTYGLIMPLITVLLFTPIILKTKVLVKSLLESFLWMLCIYFLLSTTVHPWYILFPLAIGVFTNYKFFFLWSFLVFLSYSAYINPKVSESELLLFVEYSLLLSFMMYEVIQSRRKIT